NMSDHTARKHSFGVQSKVNDWSSNGSRSDWLLDADDKRKRPGKNYIKLGSDKIDAGGGKDLVFGDFAAAIPVVERSGKAGLITRARLLPIGETSATQTANLRYVYSFGAQGPLHSAGSADVNRKSP